MLERSLMDFTCFRAATFGLHGGRQHLWRPAQPGGEYPGGHHLGGAGHQHVSLREHRWVLGSTVERDPLDADGEVPVWPPFVNIDIYASIFSSATSCFVDDGLFPVFNFFAVGRSSDGEPVRCYVLVLAICFVLLMLPSTG